MGTATATTASSTPIRRVLVAKGLRAFGDGYVSLLLPVYLLSLGFTTWQVGLIATATLLGSGLLTLLTGLFARRLRYRMLLFAATLLMAATGAGFALVTQFWPLLLIAFVGTLNPSAGDVSVFLPLEHAVLAHLADDRRRTTVFARYSLVGALLAAAGSLAAGVPDIVARATGIGLPAAIRGMFGVYAVLAGLAALAYRGLPEQSTTATTATTPARAALTASRTHVFTLAALFSLDAFAGGFIVQSMLALWLYQAFGLSLAHAATLFFAAGLLTALSYLAAARVAARFGLVNTMVFTHLPSSVCLIAMPFMPALGWVIALLLVRAALSQMDVPTRSSYVMAIVPPAERPAAAGITSVPRSLASAVSPLLAGSLLGMSAFGWPLLIAGGLKIIYDVLLYACFRHVRPREERERM